MASPFSAPAPRFDGDPSPILPPLPPATTLPRLITAIFPEVIIVPRQVIALPGQVIALPRQVIALLRPVTASTSSVTAAVAPVTAFLRLVTAFLRLVTAFLRLVTIDFPPVTARTRPVMTLRTNSRPIVQALERAVLITLPNRAWNLLVV